ncbi:hypothetical protein Tco_1378205 [Tanacetum coccineum]
MVVTRWRWWLTVIEVVRRGGDDVGVDMAAAVVAADEDGGGDCTVVVATEEVMTSGWWCQVWIWCGGRGGWCLMYQHIDFEKPMVGYGYVKPSGERFHAMRFLL